MCDTPGSSRAETPGEGREDAGTCVERLLQREGRGRRVSAAPQCLCSAAAALSVVLGSEGLGCARARRARAEGLASRCGCSAPLARGCSAVPGRLSGCSPSRRVREPCAIDVHVNCPSFYACSFSVFTVRNPCIFAPCRVKPFTFGFSSVPDRIHVRPCRFFGSCVLVRVP